MTPARRAAIVSALPPMPETVKPPGGWRFRLAGHGAELQIRNTKTPTLRLDLLRTEARDLMLTLAMALDEPTGGIVRATLWERFRDWLARRTWRKAHEAELRFALRKLAEEFQESEGGW